MFGLSSRAYLTAAAILSVAALTTAFMLGNTDAPAANDSADGPVAETTTEEAVRTQSGSETTDASGPSEVTTRLLGEGDGEVVSRSEVAADVSAAGGTAGDESMTLSVPKLGLKDVPIPSGATQERLDREGILRMSGSGLPWEAGSNTFIVGHTLGYQGTKVPYAFYELDELRPGDRITVKDSAGKAYDFEVYDEVTVRPEDYWVTYPTRDGKTTLSLQSCVPIPEFDMRLVVQAGLVEG